MATLEYRYEPLPVVREPLARIRAFHSFGEPMRHAHEYIRAGAAKQLTLFCPPSGQVRVKGVRRTAKGSLRHWLER